MDRGKVDVQGNLFPDSLPHLFLFLVLNVALFAASWCIHREIKNFYLSSGRNIESLPRPDPFAGLSETAKSNHEGEEPCSIFAPDINQILFGIVRPDY